MNYALVGPSGAINRFASNIDPTVATKAGWKWMPVDDAAAPTHNGALEVASSQYAVVGAQVIKQWTIGKRPLEAQKSAIKIEAQRRIIALTGKTELIDCMIKQSNANMRANTLNDKRLSGAQLSAQEEAEAAALRAMASQIEAIRAASDIIEAMDPIPLDYADNKHWPV